MNESKSQKPNTFGFLTILEVPELGHCGGLLLVNSIGRPIEFHCTAPINENRAKKILYGETYDAYLHCDQIGKALIAKSKLVPTVFVVDIPQLALLGKDIPTPILNIRKLSGNQPVDESQSRFSFDVGGFTLTAANTIENRSKIKSAIQQLSTSIPLDEPFERIAQAIDEAQAVVR